MVVRQSSDILGIADPRIAAAMAVIRDRASDRLSVDELAQQMGMSRRTLERRFQEMLGRGIEAEMRRVRIQRARQLLSATSMPLREVAEKAGFGDVFYFSTAFRKAENMSPGEWRRQNGNLKKPASPAERNLHFKSITKPLGKRPTR
jgi:LacI family transcriptional regulator